MPVEVMSYYEAARRMKNLLEMEKEQGEIKEAATRPKHMIQERKPG